MIEAMAFAAPAASDNSILLTALSVLTPVLVILLTGVGWLYRHERERREAIERQLSDKKHGAYIGLIETFFDQLKGAPLAKAKKSPPPIKL